MIFPLNIHFHRGFSIAMFAGGSPSFCSLNLMCASKVPLLRVDFQWIPDRTSQSCRLGGTSVWQDSANNYRNPGKHGLIFHKSVYTPTYGRHDDNPPFGVILEGGNIMISIGSPGVIFCPWSSVRSPQQNLLDCVYDRIRIYNWWCIIRAI